MQDERKPVTITLPPVVHEAGKRLASEDRRSFSATVELLVLREVEAREKPSPRQPQEAAS